MISNCVFCFHISGLRAWENGDTASKRQKLHRHHSQDSTRRNVEHDPDVRRPSTKNKRLSPEILKLNLQMVMDEPSVSQYNKEFNEELDNDEKFQDFVDESKSSTSKTIKKSTNLSISSTTEIEEIVIDDTDDEPETNVIRNDFDNDDVTSRFRNSTKWRRNPLHESFFIDVILTSDDNLDDFQSTIPNVNVSEIAGYDAKRRFKMKQCCVENIPEMALKSNKQKTETDADNAESWPDTEMSTVTKSPETEEMSVMGRLELNEKIVTKESEEADKRRPKIIEKKVKQRRANIALDEASSPKSASSENPEFEIPKVFEEKKTKSKKTDEAKPNLNTETGKSYKDFSPILDGYADLLEHLNPDDPDSEVDKVVKFILDKNILVRLVNILLARITSRKKLHVYNQEFPLLKHGRFTKSDHGEDAWIKKWWDEFVKEVPINDPERCLDDFSKLSRKNGSLLEKRNVVGCFLGQDLKNVRHGCDVFHHFLELINPYTVGKFSKEKDELILSEVKKFGETLTTWKRLKLKLNRKEHSYIMRRYKLLCAGNGSHHNPITLDEDEIILESLVGGKKNYGVEEIKLVDYIAMGPIADKLNLSEKNVTQHWNTKLKPILLSYYSETLQKRWVNDFINYTIEKKLGVQDVDHRVLIGLFTRQNSALFHAEAHSLSKQCLNKNIPSIYIDEQDSEKNQRYREDIVRIYDKVKNKK